MQTHTPDELDQIEREVQLIHAGWLEARVLVPIFLRPTHSRDARCILILRLNGRSALPAPPHADSYTEVDI